MPATFKIVQRGNEEKRLCIFTSGKRIWAAPGELEAFFKGNQAAAALEVGQETRMHTLGAIMPRWQDEFLAEEAVRLMADEPAAKLVQASAGLIETVRRSLRGQRS